MGYQWFEWFGRVLGMISDCTCPDAPTQDDYEQMWNARWNAGTDERQKQKHDFACARSDKQEKHNVCLISDMVILGIFPKAQKENRQKLEKAEKYQIYRPTEAHN